MPKDQKDPNPQFLLAEIQRFFGNWWTDGRQHHCCYCGVRLKRSKGTSPPADGATRDHVIPRAAKGRYVTIPSCRSCNQARGSMDLLVFLRSPVFSTIAKGAAASRWSEKDLCSVYALGLALNAPKPQGSKKAKAPKPQVAIAPKAGKAAKATCSTSSSSPSAVP